MSADLAPTFDRALLLVPHLEVQNANAISSPMTWGFPSITAFVGLMAALERKLGADCGLQFNGVGVVCHRFEAQTHRGYTHSFRLSRNPVRKDGSTAGIVEEGRIHLDISLVFDVSLSSHVTGDAERQQLSQTVDDLLQAHQHTLTQRQSEGQPTPATALDAWLDLSRINTRAVRVPVPAPPVEGQALVLEAANAKPAAAEPIEWQRDERPGWLVPIAVGYAALSALHPAGSVAQARDATTPLRFVESVFSIGQWISPHRLRDAAQLIWWPTYDEATGLYRCRNACAPETFKGSVTALAVEPATPTPSETVSA